VTTKAAERDHALVDDAVLAATLLELETRAVSAFRTVRAPALEAQRVARETDDEEALQRANLLLADGMMREGRVGEGGRIAHQALAWAEQNDSPYVLARAHRALSIFYRLVGDISDSLTHGVQAVAHLTDDVPIKIRARHLMTLAVGPSTEPVAAMSEWVAATDALLFPLFRGQQGARRWGGGGNA
jgi:hypothetical protein